ncbi:YheC/YheD family protein [Ammoniphilus sp. 3BR4]|uniref:YheC/YheD family protein n=1 Tax=Ammoniphilus sp. 3BR4 TaxID=3158265 RepID=UPI003466C551
MNLFQKPHPNIGICVSNDKPCLAGIVKKRLEKYPNDASLIKFQIKDMNFNNLRVKGHHFRKKKGVINEDQGFFPLPDAIYLQCHVELEVIKKLERVIGRKVFNNLIFDKWKGWDILSKDVALRDHLPATQRLFNKTDFPIFLNSHRDIFIKPMSSLRGHSSQGIFRVQLQKDGSIQMFYRQGSEMRNQQFQSFLEVQDQFFIPNKYILQKGIQTVKCGGKATDIRLNMSKNRLGKWEVSNLLFRIASNSSHIIPEDVMVFPINDLRKAYPDFKISEMSISNIGYRICYIFDKLGYHMGDLGIDLGVDENGHVWIFEVNPLPFPFTLNPPQQDHSWIRPLEYALYLASK